MSNTNQAVNEELLSTYMEQVKEALDEFLKDVNNEPTDGDVGTENA